MVKTSLKVLSCCLAVFLFAMLSGSGNVALASEVHIPDPQLEAMIRIEIKKENGPITVGDLESLPDLNLACGEIADLTGLQHATGLKSLILSHNLISDLSPLANLTNLERLFLG
ncbi:MAG: leucine-rich repeat domain-containing protein, partial [Firmicutes bacterium]|nr:leucine-rich repeat domain-containing protein [Bacillota bacterium]